MINTTEIPEGVVDIKSWKKYLAFSQHPILKNPIYLTSTQEEINFSILPHLFAKKIAHLSLKEQETLMELKHKWMEMNVKRNVQFSMAYGKQGKGRTAGKIVPFEEDVKELLGKLFTIDEVVRIMVMDNGIECTREQIAGVLRKNISDIEKMREGFKNKVTDCRLYNKRSRLEELSWMYSEMKLKYSNTEGQEAFNAMLRVLEQIRKESEGDVININGAFEITIEAEIKQHIYQEIYKTINLREIILGRVAARMNYNYGKLVAGLHNGYYSKFVDISGEYEPTAEMIFPSTQNYDFTKIELPGGHDEGNIQEEQPPQEKREETKSAAENIRNILLEKIKMEKEEINNKQNEVKVEAELNQKKKQQVEVKERVISRGNGRSRDEKIASNKTRGKAIFKNVDYYTGEKKKKK